MKHRKTVLLADGSDEFRWLMWRIAEKYSHISIMTVGTGRDVLLSIQKHMPDLLLMDVALPDICGLTVLEELRQQGLAPKTIFLSGVVSDPNMVLQWLQCFQCGRLDHETAKRDF